MATVVQQHRGTTAQHATYVGPEGSITVDIDKDVVVVHDGVTAGGHPMAADKNVVHTTGDETVNGTKTFSSSPQVPSVDAFDASTNAASTEQVDDALQTMVARVDTLPTDPAALAALKAKLRNNAIVWALDESSSGGSLDEVMEAIAASDAKAAEALNKANAAGTVKSVNGNTPDASGNVTVSTGSTITLNNTVTSTSTTEAATANAVKTAYDRATTALNTANAAGTVKSVNGLSANENGSVVAYGKCTTGPAIAEKIVTIDGEFTPTNGALFIVDFTSSNSAASPTLNVNGTGAKPVYLRGGLAGYSSWYSSARAFVRYLGDLDAYELIDGKGLSVPITKSIFINRSTSGNWSLSFPALATGDTGQYLWNMVLITAKDKTTTPGSAVIDIANSTGILGDYGSVTIKAGQAIMLQISEARPTIVVSSITNLILTAHLV